MKKLLILTSVILFTLALMLFIPNEVSAAPLTTGELKITDIDNNSLYLCTGGAETGTVISGATYDKETNTLTLNGFNGRRISATDMGDDFKIKVVNNNTATIIESSNAIELIGNGTLIVNVDEWETCLITGWEGSELGIYATDNVKIDGPTIKMTLSNQGVSAEGIVSEGKITINSGTIEINGLVENAINCYNFGNIEINGGNLMLSATEIALSAYTNLIINGGNLTLNSDDIGIYSTQEIKFNGGTTTIDAKNIAVLVDNIDPQVNITLATKMSIDDGVSITNSSHYLYGYDMYFATFGTGTVSVNLQTGEFLNVVKELTIKENTSSSGTTTGTQTPVVDSNKEDTNQSTNQNTNTLEKDDTPKTGNILNSIIDTKIAIVMAVLLIAFAVIVKKSK